MDDEFVATVKNEDDGLEQTSLRVESESQLAGGRIVVEVFDPERPGGCLSDVIGCDAVLSEAWSSPGTWCSGR